MKYIYFMLFLIPVSFCDQSFFSYGPHSFRHFERKDPDFSQLNCQKITQASEEIFASQLSQNELEYSKCWSVEVPEGSYVRIDPKELTFEWPCAYMFIKIMVVNNYEIHKFCEREDTRKIIIALNNVNITYYHSGIKAPSRSSFRLQLTRETGILATQGIVNNRLKAKNWIANKINTSSGWGMNTYRAITAVYLSSAMMFISTNLDHRLKDLEDRCLDYLEIDMQLNLQTSLDLFRNESEPMSINELSMIVNALAVTCNDPWNFYAYNLVQTLYDRVMSAKYPVPSAYLTLCNLNWTLSDSDVKNLMTLLENDSQNSFQLGSRALTIMALTCFKNNMVNFSNIANAQNVYESTIQMFSNQFPDGSFGDVHTTALVTQALISSGHEKSEQWNATAAMLYLMKKLNSPSVDFLTVYLTLPILSGRSLLDIKNPDCSNYAESESKDKDVSVIMGKQGRKIQIQYSLYIGEQKNVMYSIHLRIPEKSSAYDVMKIAEAADPKFKFLHRQKFGDIDIYEIAGIANDPVNGKFWLLYTSDRLVNDLLKYHTKSPDYLILENNDHLIMWYRTAYI